MQLWRWSLLSGHLEPGDPERLITWLSPRIRKAYSVIPSLRPKAWQHWGSLFWVTESKALLESSSSDVQRQEKKVSGFEKRANFPFLGLFILSRLKADWMVLAHIEDGSSQTHTPVSSRGTLTGTARNTALLPLCHPLILPEYWHWPSQAGWWCALCGVYESLQECSLV